ncbi:MAG: hypothetical protein WKG01_40305 [Kofleriaceae bacterium]
MRTSFVADHPIPPAAIEELAERGLPALRELAIGSRLEQDAALAIAQVFGPQLARLDCRRARFSDAGLARLRESVAGDVVLGAEPPGRMLDVSVRPREPWLDYGHVTIAT